jgi:hypothetical protein
MSPYPPKTPTMRLGAALGQSEPLARLMQRLRESNACLEAVRTVLPAGLMDQVRPGPLDETGWTLLVSSNAAAAKLRQCLPLVEKALLEQRRQVIAVKVKILPRPPP